MNESQDPSPKLKRPITLKILCVAILPFVILNLVRIIGAIDYWTLMFDLGMAVLPLYQVLSGLIWVIVGAAAMIGLWFRKPWAFWLTILAAVLFTAWYWLERGFLAGSIDANANWFFVALVNIILLVVVFCLLALVKEDVFQGKVNL